MTDGVLQQLKDTLREKVNIVEVVGEHVVLRKAGGNYSGLCPFHSERSPSFSVNENKQVYHCFGCKKGGDLISFVQEIHGLSFMETLEELAERARIAMPKDWGGGASASEDPEVAQRRAAAREKLQTAHKLNRFAAAFFRDSLPRQRHIDQYFLNRGVGAPDVPVSAALARNFYVGAAPASWDALSAHLVAKKAPLPLAVELGLIRPSQKATAGGPGYFDLFRNRAMFPILDMRGKVAGFGGRALPTPEDAPDVGGESPKYLNSPESLIFQKSKLAYGLYQAQKHIREKDEILLVEGYFDVLGLHLAGFENAVATCGTALTADHLAIFRRLGKKITVLFDGDKAGIAATERAMEIGLEHGLVLYGASIPDGLDPDEVLVDQETGLIRPDGVERMQAILSAAVPLLDARISESVKAAQQGPEARTQSVKRIAGWLAKFKDPVGREVRLQTVQQELGVGRQLLEGAMGVPPSASTSHGGAPRPPSRPVPRPVPRPVGGRPAASTAPPKKFPTAERLILACLVRESDSAEYRGVFDQIRSHLPPEMTFSSLFDHPTARDWVQRMLVEWGGLQNLRGLPDRYLQDDLDPQVRSTITEALVALELKVTAEELKVALSRQVGRAWARFSQQIKKALADAEAKEDAGLREKLMKEYLDVQRKMKEFSTFYDEA